MDPGGGCLGPKKKKILVGKIFPKKEKKKDLEPPYFVAQAPLQKSWTIPIPTGQPRRQEPL